MVNINILPNLQLKKYKNWLKANLCESQKIKRNKWDLFNNNPYESPFLFSKRGPQKNIQAEQTLSSQFGLRSQ